MSVGLERRVEAVDSLISQNTIKEEKKQEKKLCDITL